MRKTLLYILLLQLDLVGLAQVKDSSWVKAKAIEKPWDNLSLKTYGVVNYYNFDWETDPDKRNAVDLERINMYMKYRFSDKVSLKTEFEFEHGGTGVTMEFDKFEEFGEFEEEVENGGEVLLEQLNIVFDVKPWLKIRAGRLKLYLGVASKLDETPDYFTGYRSIMENTLLPLGWYEIGTEISGDLGQKKKWSYKAYLVNGLSSANFSSANWVKRGHQKRFEMANAENLAIAGRFDYNLLNKGWLGISGYYGNTTGNRPKNDMRGIDAYVSMFDVHANVNAGPVKFRAMILYGQLQNADKVSKANRSLSNNLGVKRTPVASETLGYYAEIGYDVLSLTKVGDKKMFVFARYDFYDTMFGVHKDFFKNPRWERKAITVGVNYLPALRVVIKAHYAVQTLGFKKENTEKTFLLGIGYSFKTNNY